MDTETVLQGKRILIADDEDDVLATIQELLSSCRVDTASTYEEARVLLESVDYDAVILDIMGIRGYDLLEISRRKKNPGADAHRPCLHQGRSQKIL